MGIDTSAKKIKELLTRGVEEVIVKENLEKKLKSGKKLRVKFGIDPTGASLHIGHAVSLRKLKQFQDLGHQIILLIGDYTAMIGDPSGRNETRPMLSAEQVQENMKTYLDQAKLALDLSGVEVRHNSEWYGRQDFMGLLMDLTGKISVQRVLERDDFQNRLKEGADIRMQELLYPLLQGYDSVALNADVEIGGTDQKFNLLMGRKLQRRYDQEEQDIITVPILEGTDGERKMSKTYDNFIALLDSPADMYGKVMSIPDSLIIKYFELATGVPVAEIEKIKKQLAAGANPRDLKMKLAEELVKIYHSKKEAKEAEAQFIATFSKKELPSEIPSLSPASYNIVSVLIEAKFVKSKAEARRAIEQGGVRVNDQKISSFDIKINSGDIVQKGKRWFVKVL